MHRSVPLLGAAALLLAAACGDRAPTAAPPPAAPVPDAVAALECRVDVGTGTLSCGDAAPATMGISAAVLGGQGTSVRLRNTGNAVQGDTFRMDVTVENLVGQALGTADGMTADPAGVRVFLQAGPASSQGGVEVANGGRGFFTAPDQPFFQYDGILAPGDTTGAVEWRFVLEPGVESFQFVAYVTARVAREAGWVRVAPMLPAIAVGGTVALAPTVMSMAGQPVAGPVTWTSSHPAIATVDSAGVVTGVGTGTATVTATSGTRTGSVPVLVGAPSGDAVPPTVHTLSFSPAHIRAGGTDSVTVALQATDAQTGIQSVQVRFRSPTAAQIRFCGTSFQTAGAYRCRVGIPRYSEGGAWRVESITVKDGQGNSRTVSWNQLLPTGMPHWLHVESPDGDAQAPVLTSVAFAPLEATAGVDSIRVSLGLTDAGTGLENVTARFMAPGNVQSAQCTAYTASTGTRNGGEFRCRAPLPRTAAGGTWRLFSIHTQDDIGNSRLYEWPALQAAGHPMTLTVVSPDADATLPALTSLSFAPTAVAANGLDSVTVHMGVVDTGTGVQDARVRFDSPTGAHRTECTASFGTGTRYGGTYRCKVAVPAGSETGAWRVHSINLRDFAGNYRTVWPADLEAAGDPVTLDVTG